MKDMHNLNLYGLFNKTGRNAERLYVTIADTPSKQERGLMYKKDMPENEGMYFVFSGNRKLSFWGENTYLPLDIAFVDKDGIIKNIEKISPLSKKTVSSNGLCCFAIETNDGFFTKNNISIGDKVFLNKDADNIPYLSFVKKKRNHDIKREISTGKQLIAQLDQLSQQDGDFNQNDITNNENLPILDVGQLGKILEDDIEDQEQADQSNFPTDEEITGEPPIDVSTEPEQPEFEYPNFGNVFDAAEWAEENSEVMRISYTTNSGISIIRDIEPHGSFHAKTTNRQILVTFDQTVGDIRAFILTNIHAFSFVGERFLKKFRVI